MFTCIAQHESGLNANAMNLNGKNLVVGLFQETDDNGYSAQQLCKPKTAAVAAKKLMAECGICPWLDDPCMRIRYLCVRVYVCTYVCMLKFKASIQRAAAAATATTNANFKLCSCSCSFSLCMMCYCFAHSRHVLLMNRERILKCSQREQNASRW